MRGVTQLTIPPPAPHTLRAPHTLISTKPLPTFIPPPCVPQRRERGRRVFKKEREGRAVGGGGGVFSAAVFRAFGRRLLLLLLSLLLR